MQTNTIRLTAGGVDLEELDRHIAAMYRDVAHEAGRDLHFPTGRKLAEALGYPIELLDRLPTAAVSSFAGVGYHLGLARLLSGERVLDLGSGSGMDVFAAAAQVGPGGAATGVDITPEQLAKSERLRRRPGGPLPRGHRRRRPRGAARAGQPGLPLRERARPAHEPQVRRPQHLAARAQADTCIPPHLPPGFGWWRRCCASGSGGGFPINTTTMTEEVSK